MDSHNYKLGGRKQKAIASVGGLAIRGNLSKRPHRLLFGFSVAFCFQPFRLPFTAHLAVPHDEYFTVGMDVNEPVGKKHFLGIVLIGERGKGSCVAFEAGLGGVQIEPFAQDRSTLFHALFDHPLAPGLAQVVYSRLVDHQTLGLCEIHRTRSSALIVGGLTPKEIAVRSSDVIVGKVLPDRDIRGRNCDPANVLGVSAFILETETDFGRLLGEHVEDGSVRHAECN